MAKRGSLNCREAQSLRRDLKLALTNFAAGKDNLQQMLNQIERVMKSVCRDPRATLGNEDTVHCMAYFISKHAAGSIENTGLPGLGWCRLYDYVTEYRNDIAHTGTEAALAATRTTALTTILLEALLHAGRNGDETKISDVMVANPTCAEGWQTLADLRRTMLINDFSVLPLRQGKCGDKWQVVRAEELAAYLSSNKTAHKETLCCARGKGLTHFAMVVSEDKKVKDLDEKGNFPSTVIVIRNEDIIGLVTAFDLL